MVDFSKKIGARSKAIKTNPVEIYETLDRSTDKGPLRPAQKYILEDWFKRFSEKKDVIIKLHTGQGKTLVGLLILQSKLNNNLGPALYLCPNKYLVNQTCEQAKQFGIKFCTIREDNKLPFEFLNGEQILITNAQKLFNGYSIFGLDNKSENVNSIVLDDSHACINSIKESFTIKIKKDKPAFHQILQLFESDLSYQGVGTFSEIRAGKYDSFLPIPYWAWFERYVEVSEILVKQKDEDNQIKFSWELLKDNIRECQCIVSGSHIEITPHFNPIHKYGSFFNAQHRVLMSATTVDDSFFLNGLQLEIEAINSPLKYPEEKWSGEKMILIPSLIDARLDRTEIINNLAKPNTSRDYGVIALVPSFFKSEIWEACGAKIIKTDDINSDLENLKDGSFSNLMVLVNRYDGIDLPDNKCRILFLDSKPLAHSLEDQYQESCRQNSEIINVKTAQIIEQGLGRSVRGEKDYSAIIILDGELVNLLRSQKTRKYFSDQTKRQIDLGLSIANMAKEEVTSHDIKESLEVIHSLTNQLLSRDPGWKNYYIEQMEEIPIKNKEYDILPTLMLERDAEERFYCSDYETAAIIYQKIIDNHCFDHQEKGWYLQNKARCIYLESKSQSITLQNAAFNNNRYLLKPIDIKYKRLTPLSGNRVANIINTIKPYLNYEELKLKIDAIAGNLEFGVKADKFEQALDEFGQFLGFKTERPDKEWKEGPDNLWCIEDNKYILFECKNEVDIRRAEITKAESGQMNNSIAWFNKNYKTSNVTRFMIIPSRVLGRAAGFNETVHIMQCRNLKQLVKNFKQFFKEFNGQNFNDINTEQILEIIIQHELDNLSLTRKYGVIPMNT